MSNVKLDLSKFKHVSSDKNSTKLRHEHGHFLVLSHKNLSKDNQDQLAALVPKKFKDGGKVADNAKEMANDVVNAMSPEAIKRSSGVMIDSMKSMMQGNPGIDSKGVYHGEPQYTDAPPAEMKAHGGEVPCYAEGDRVRAPSNQPDKRQYNPREKPIDPKFIEGVEHPWENVKKEVKAVLGYADGGDVSGQDYASERAPSIEAAANPINEEYARKGAKFQDSIKNIPNVVTDMPDEAPEENAPAYARMNPASMGNRQSAQVLQKAAPEAPQVPKDEVAFQKLYNQIVTGNVRPEEQATKPWAVFGPNGEPPKSFDAGAAQTAEQQLAMQKEKDTYRGQQKTADIEAQNQVRLRHGQAPLAVPGANVPSGEVPDQQPAPTEPQQQSMPEPQQPGVGSAVQNSQNMLESGYEKKLAGIEQQGQAQADLGQQQAEALARSQEAQQNAQISFKKHYDNLEAERQNHIHDIKAGYMDPNQYWTGDKNGNGGHSKIAAGIGMILAGFNPTNSPNAAVNFLKYQMDQNLEAQKQNLGSKQNLLSANLRQFGNLRDAQDMTRLMQADLMQNELHQAAAKAQTPMAKAAALAAAGQLQMESAPMFQQFAMRRAIMDSASSGSGGSEHLIAQMRVLNPEMAKEMESRYVPGVGMAGIPVTPEVRGQLVAHKQLDNAAKDLYQWASKHSTIVPGTPEYNIGAQKAQALQQLYRHGTLHTVYREGEQPLLDKVVNGNPAGFLKYFSTLPKLKEVISANDKQFNVLKQSYGLPVLQQAPEAQYKTVHGIKYMRGPNGEAIKVK